MQLDVFFQDEDDLCPSDHSESEAVLGSELLEEEAPEWFFHMRPTRPSDNFLSEKIARDKVWRIEKKEKDRTDGPSSQDPTLFRLNMATV